MFYAAGLYVVRRWWPVDVKLSTAGDVGRMTLIFLISAVPTAIVGTLTLLGDGVSERAAFTKTASNWWESDAISILTFTPMLLLYVAPFVSSWMYCGVSTRKHLGGDSHKSHNREKIKEVATQAASFAAALWLVFRFPPAIPYQPLYALFIPVIWISVRRGLRGASVATFAINCGAMFLVDAATLM
jgi:integral membrane sensor domain MASE1